MDTKTPRRAGRSRNGQAKPTVTFKSKSDWARHMFAAGRTVAEVKDLSLDPASGSLGPMDYAFAYGVAKRYGFALTAAARKKGAQVTHDREKGLVTCRIDTGAVLEVDLATGKVRTVKAAPKPTPAKD